jgi:hypothetical protein
MANAGGVSWFRRWPSSRLVCALQKLQQHGVGIGGLADPSVGWRELAKVGLEQRRVGPHSCARLVRRFGVGLGVEDPFAVGPGPVAGAADLMGIRLPHAQPRVCSRCTTRCSPAEGRSASTSDSICVEGCYLNPCRPLRLVPNDFSSKQALERSARRHDSILQKVLVAT